MSTSRVPSGTSVIDMISSSTRCLSSSRKDDGVIRGYHADIDFEQCDRRITNLFVCDADLGDRENLARTALQVPGVVNVRELRSGKGNLQIKAVGEDVTDLSRIAEQLGELGLTIEDEGTV